MPAFATDVGVRAGKHDGYARLVFDWPTAVRYSLKPTGSGEVHIAFSAGGTIRGRVPRDTGLALRNVSTGDSPLALDVAIPPGSTYRASAEGRKIILDVYPGKPVKPQDVVPASGRIETKPAIANSINENANAAPSKTESAKPATAPVALVAPTVSPAIALPAEAAVAVESQPDTITLSGVAQFGLAVFRDGDALWIVADRPDFAVPPQLAGPNKDKFPAIVRVPVVGGSGWMVRLPDDTRIPKVEGGGLIWKIVLSQKEPAQKPIDPQRQYEAGKPSRNGTLLWPFAAVGKVLDVPDPSRGATLKVVTVGKADQAAGAPWQFVDLETLPSMTGLAVLPHAANLTVRRMPNGVSISRPEGLALSRAEDIAEAGQVAQKTQENATRAASGLRPGLYDFPQWQMGGPLALPANQTALLGDMPTKDADGQAQDLLSLAEANMANDRGPEALGFLNYAAAILPGLSDGPQFAALLGAAEALAGKYELAFHDLSNPVLANYPEVNFWKAYALSWLEDWQQASATAPTNPQPYLAFPLPLLERTAPRMAEIALRGGNVKLADQYLHALDSHRSELKPWTAAATDYLSGQSELQKGNFDAAKKLWTPLLTGADDLYRVRAGLALTMQEAQRKKITPAQAIDRLEGLRYAWRGDGLEARINYSLGRFYVDDGQYLKGFGIMRDAVSMSPDTAIAQEINDTMAKRFEDLLMNDPKIPATDAVTLYQTFKELAPQGDEGNRLVQKLAERLVSSDLMGRAAELLQDQVNNRLQGKEQADVAIRLAAIALLNKDPGRAGPALDRAAAYYGAQPAGAERDKRLRDITLLRARTLSEAGKPKDAIAMLNGMPLADDVNRLRVDIAWQAGAWADASEALNDVIADQNIDPAKPIADAQADLILNRCVALNLAGDRVELGAMREKFGGAMAKSSRGKLFDVITQPHALNLLAEKQTVDSLVGDVDMFKDFLNDYKTVTSNKTQPAPPP